MVLVAFSSISRPVGGWLEWYFSFLFAFCPGCLEPFSWAHVHISRTGWPESATSGFTFSIITHLYISINFIILILFSKCCNCESWHYPFDLYRYLVSDLRAWHENNQSLYVCNSISFPGNA